MKVFIIEWLTMNTKKPYKKRKFGTVYTKEDEAQAHSRILCDERLPCCVVEFKEAADVKP